MESWEDHAIITLLDLPLECIYYIFNFLEPIHLFILKSVNQYIYENVHFYKNKNLFMSLADIWCQVLLFQPSNFFHKFNLIKFDEHILISIGIILDQFPKTNIFDKWNIVKKGRSQNLFIITFYKGTFTIDILQVLKILNNEYNDNVIIQCIRSLIYFLEKADKPWGNEDFNYNSEEFFWRPLTYLHEDWFCIKYRNIFNVLNKAKDLNIFC